MKDSKHMTARIWSKPVLQDVLRQVRRQSDNLEVIKTDAGIDGIKKCEVVHTTSDVCVLRALNGRHGYLVRFDTRLFNRAQK